MRRFADFLLLRRGPVGCVLAIAFTICALAIPTTEFNLSLAPLIRANPQLMRDWIDLQDVLPEQRHSTGILALEWPREVTVDDLQACETLFQNGLNATDFLAWAPVVDPADDGALSVGRFDRTIGTRSVLEHANRHPLLSGRLISHDGRSLAILLDSDPDIELATKFFDANIPAPIRWRLVSGNAANHNRQEHMVDDILMVVGLEFAVFGLLLPFVFRSWRGIVVPLGTVLLAISMSFGSLALAGMRFTIIDVAVPGLIVVIGLSDAIHMMHRFEEELARGATRHEAIRQMIRRVGAACVLTSLTTAIGFLSLLVSDHSAVKAFGIKAAYSVLLTLATTITILPIALSVWPTRRAAPARLPGIDRFDYRWPKTIVVVTALVVILGTLGLNRATVDSRWLEELPPDDPVAQDLAWFEENFHGFMQVDFHVHGDLDDPTAVRAIDRMCRELIAGERDVHHADTYVEWVREIAGQPEDLDDDAITRGLSGLRIAGNRFPEHLVNTTFTDARLQITTDNIGSQRYFELGETMAELARSVAPELRPELCGRMRVAHENVRTISATLLESLGLSLLAITAVIGIVYRSARIALISIAPNVLPIFVALALTGWLEIPVRVGIVMIFSLGLGLAVDDSIHVLTRYCQERALHRDSQESLLRALRSTGGALVVTTIVLGIGSLCHLPASFQSMRDVGVLMSAIVGTALAADMWLLPLLLERFAKAR